MGNIHILDEDSINKIAAGEVIERPASVVKELVENAIDSGATKIFVDILGAGTIQIKVTDNGEGMDESDVKLSYQRHTTSKIFSAADLTSIRTLGFRGEALASIAAVSKFTVISKKDATLEGTKVYVEGGKFVKSSRVASNKGTTIEVKDLFFNTPARKKHLQSASTEVSHITDIVQRYSLNYPKIHFKLNIDGKVVLNSPATEDLLANIANIYGADYAKQLVKVEYENEGMEIAGFIGKPSLTKPDHSHQSIFINGRYVKSETVGLSLDDSFHTLVMVNKYPVATLNLTIDPHKIDVNVHPNKQIVKFSDEQKVYASVFDAVRQTLHENDLFSEAKVPELQEQLEEIDNKAAKARQQERKYRFEKGAQEVLLIEEEELPVNVLGVIDKTYIVAEDKDNMLIIDQHAMHERVMYERFMNEFMAKKIGVQTLIMPMMLDFSPADKKIVEANLENFSMLGILMEPFGGNSFAVKTLPVLLGSQQDKEIISELLAEFKKNKTKKFDEIKEEAIIIMACRAAIKAGDDLPLQKLKQLVGELLKTKSPYTCPHGRPIIIKFPISELEKKFKRVV